MPYTYGFDGDCGAFVQWEADSVACGKLSNRPFVGMVFVPRGWMQKARWERVAAFRRLRDLEAFSRKSYGDGGYFTPEEVMDGKIPLFVEATDPTTDLDRALADIAAFEVLEKVA
jgi:hypothetical protein